MPPHLACHKKTSEEAAASQRSDPHRPQIRQTKSEPDSGRWRSLTRLTPLSSLTALPKTSGLQLHSSEDRYLPLRALLQLFASIPQLIFDRDTSRALPDERSISGKSSACCRESWPRR